MIIDFTVSSKKGDIQLTTWNIEQNACYNSIHRNYWRKEEIKEEYTIILLINGSEENTYRNQSGMKGYYYENNERKEFKNPSIVFRGREMGPIVLNCRKHYNGEYNIIPNDYGRYTAGEIEFLKSNVYPKILNHITSNKHTLYEDARKRSIEYMQDAMNEYKKALIGLEQEMNEIIKTF